MDKSVLNQYTLFTKEECNKIIQYTKSDNIFFVDESEYEKYDLVSKNRVHKSNKKYDPYLLRYNENTKWIFEKLLDWFTQETSISINWNTITYGLIHNYHIGDAFPKHIDKTNTAKKRVYNVGIQLNNEYSGGEYILYEYNGSEYIINPNTGNASYYKSDVLHEVRPIINGDRWSFLIHLYEYNIIDTNPKFKGII